MIKFLCSNCNHKIVAPEKYAGKRVRCPKCKAPTRVPEVSEKTDTQEPTLIKFRCPNCNQKIAVTPDFAGKRVRCAKCRNPLQVPQASGQPSHPVVKDETEILRAGHEQHPAEEGGWRDMGNIDELLLAETNAPSVEMQAEQRPIDYGPEQTGSGPYAQSTAERKPPKKKRSIIFIGAVCILGLLLAGIVVRYFLSAFSTIKSEKQPQLYEVQEFAEQYIGLLENGEIDKAGEMLSPGLASDVQKDDVEKLAKQISKSKIVELVCRQTHFEENPEGGQFFLWYNLVYEDEDDEQYVIVSIVEIDEELAIDGIAAQEPSGGTVSIGANSYEELSDIVLAATFEKFTNFFTRFFCGFAVVALVLGLVQIVSMWIVFSKAGQPGWAAIVPFYNMWVLAEVGDKPGWWGLSMCFCGLIPYVGPIVQLVLMIMISIGVARSFGRGVGFGIGLSLVPFVFYPILAFSSD